MQTNINWYQPNHWRVFADNEAGSSPASDVVHSPRGLLPHQGC